MDSTKFVTAGLPLVLRGVDGNWFLPEGLIYYLEARPSNKEGKPSLSMASSCTSSLYAFTLGSWEMFRHSILIVLRIRLLPTIHRRCQAHQSI